MVCVGGEEQPESHLEEVQRSPADVLLQRPGSTSEGGSVAPTFLLATAAQMLQESHGRSPPQVDCHDYDSDGTHDLIGSFTTKVSELQKAAHGSPVRVWHLSQVTMGWRLVTGR